MNIGEASKASGVSAKLIRYYESIGLIPEAVRTASGYRVYRPGDVATLRFVKRARSLGFSIADVQALVGLRKDIGTGKADAHAMALRHVADLEARMAEMQEMVGELRTLADACAIAEGCPILDTLEGRA